MTDCKRTGKRWTTAEVLNLQREYELLEWSVQQIADKHQRSVQSILFKLHAEELTPSLYEATGYTNEKKTPLAKVATKVSANVSKPKVVETDDVESDTDSSSDFNDDDFSEYNSVDDFSVEKNVNTLSERVWSLETSVGQINTMVKQMFDQMTKTKKLAPLRKVAPNLK
jgi:hypothetical protein